MFAPKYTFLFLLFLILFVISNTNGYKKREDKTKCPQVKAQRNLNLHQMLGSWYVVQYYATSEEELIYKCMRAVFSMPTEGLEVEMNVTYSFSDDPDNDILSGNITWRIPQPAEPAHWVHEEDTYEGIYNTYILDSDNNEWCLLLHCAEKPKSPRYLTSLIMSRNTTLPPVVISYLRDKLPKYDISLEYMFPMLQTDCEDPSRNLHYAINTPTKSKHAGRKHPFKHRGRRSKANKNKQNT